LYSENRRINEELNKKSDELQKVYQMIAKYKEKEQTLERKKSEDLLTFSKLPKELLDD